LLAREPLLIDSSGTENLQLKASFSAYLRKPLGGKTERIPGRGNTVILEAQKLRPAAAIYVGIVTEPPRVRQIITVTAPDGSVQLATAPIYGRYGSVSAQYHVGTADGGYKNSVESFPVSQPGLGAELIDMTRPLRPWSRSVLSLLTQEDMLKAEKDHAEIKLEQHFN